MVVQNLKKIFISLSTQIFKNSVLRIKSIESLGILFAIMAYFSFSLLDTVQKTAVIYHSVFQLLFIKYCFVLILSLFESQRKKNYLFYRSDNIKLQILRSILSIIESGCFILSFKYLSLAEAHSIASLTPVLVVALSAILLREYVSLKTWIAIFIGFIGVLIIMRPGLSIFDPKSLIPLTGAFFLSIYQIVTRKVSEKDSNETDENLSNIDSDDIVISLEGALQISDFVWKGLNQYYYWQEEVSDLDDRKALVSSEYAKYINNNPEPEEFFESLKHENDRFSYINSDYVALQNSLQGIVASNGVEFGTSNR